tara:strand:- start:1928 stop:2455 length:528 start_codon:yes stop_codon:yes gene_type:complete
MATVYDVLKGIHQAAANAYDGAHDEKISHDGKARKAGLNREEGDVVLDSRLMDGFNVSFMGDKLILKYQGECRLSDTHDRNKFENEIHAKIKDIVKYLKKEYKDLTKDTLTLTKIGDSEILVQYISRVRCTVQASCIYNVGGLKDVVSVREPSDEKRLDKAVRNWLSLGKNDVPR